VILVIPLLFETADYRGWLNRTLTVDCAEETQIARALSRSGLSEQTVRAIMARQLSREQRLKLADDAIRNDDSLIELRREVFELNRRYLSLAKISN
jgi:dephospho-CoA kinase